jgi:hypothetical protein
MDFFDTDIEDRLRSLEEEEARLEATGAYAPEEEDDEVYIYERIYIYEYICIYSS